MQNSATSLRNSPRFAVRRTHRYAKVFSSARKNFSSNGRNGTWPRRKIDRMPPRRLAGSQETDPDATKATISARSDRDGLQTHRCGKLRFSESRATNGRQRKGAGENRSTARCRNHRNRGERKGCGARDRNRSRDDAWLSLFDL